MSVGKICSRNILTARRGEPLITVAHRMCDEHLGSVIVIDDHGGRLFPVGMLTDRDVMRAQLRHAADMSTLSVGEACTREPLVLREDLDVAEALQRLRARGVRRAPVIDQGGLLVGIVSVDDLLAHLAAQLSNLAKLVASQPRREAA